MALSGVNPSTGLASWSFHACQPAFSLLSSAFSTVAFICENNGTPDNSRAKPSAVKAIRRIFLLQFIVVTRTIDTARNCVNQRKHWDSEVGVTRLRCGSPTNHRGLRPVFALPFKSEGL